MAINVEENKTYYVYFEIFNQITHKRLMSFTMNEISFNDVTENVLSRTVARVSGTHLDGLNKLLPPQLPNISKSLLQNQAWQIYVDCLYIVV